MLSDTYSLDTLLCQHTGGWSTHTSRVNTHFPYQHIQAGGLPAPTSPHPHTCARLHSAVPACQDSQAAHSHPHMCHHGTHTTQTDKTDARFRGEFQDTPNHLPASTQVVPSGLQQHRGCCTEGLRQPTYTDNQHTHFPCQHTETQAKLASQLTELSHSDPQHTHSHTQYSHRQPPQHTGTTCTRPACPHQPCAGQEPRSTAAAADEAPAFTIRHHKSSLAPQCPHAVRLCCPVHEGMSGAWGVGATLRQAPPNPNTAPHQCAACQPEHTPPKSWWGVRVSTHHRPLWPRWAAPTTARAAGGTMNHMCVCNCYAIKSVQLGACVARIDRKRLGSHKAIGKASVLPCGAETKRCRRTGLHTPKKPRRPTQSPANSPLAVRLAIHGAHTILV